jgi:hypothetical protein
MGTDAAERDEREINGGWSLVREHLALFVAVVPIGLALIRVALLSDFDVTTAKAVLQSLSPVEVILGTLVDVGAYLLFTGGVLLLGVGFRKRARGVYSLCVIAGGLLSLAVLLNSQMWIAAVLVVTTLLALAIYVAEWPRPRQSTVGFLLVLLIATPVLTAWLVGAGSWLPEERITVEGRAPVTGFVLNAGFHWTTVLVPSDDRVLHLRTDQVRTRTLCGEHARARSVLEFIRGEEGSSYPDC